MLTADELLSEPIERARLRENLFWDQFPEGCRERVVLVGAGTLGRKVLLSLRKTGVTPIAFADSDASLQGKERLGVMVVSLEDAAKRWGQTSLFIVSIFHPNIDEGMQFRLNLMRMLGCKWVTSFLPLAWAHPSDVLPHFGVVKPSVLLQQSQNLRLIERSFEDNISAEIFRQQLLWRLRADFSETLEPSSNQYFPPDLIMPSKSERFVDAGAFNGDTLRTMSWQPTKVWAIEPDPLNFASLRRQVGSEVQMFETALGRVPGLVQFDAQGTMGSARSSDGRVQVHVSTLDEILRGKKNQLLLS